jgi:hypothetical protein
MNNEIFMSFIELSCKTWSLLNIIQVSLAMIYQISLLLSYYIFHLFKLTLLIIGIIQEEMIYKNMMEFYFILLILSEMLENSLLKFTEVK